MSHAVQFRHDARPVRDTCIFMAGLFIGAGLGALFLPRSGRETRRAIRRTAAGGRERLADLTRKLQRKNSDPDGVSDPAEISGGFQPGEEAEAVLAPLENH